MERKLQLVSSNSHGVFQQTGKTKTGKPILEPNWDGCKIVYGDRVISENPGPKYEGWTYDDYVKTFHRDQSVRFLEPMSAQEPEEYEQSELDIAELKMDGHRGLLFLNADGNRAFSRRISKQTGWYNENSDQIPHIRDFIVEGFEGTVLDGEFDLGGDSMDVQSIMGAKPENAVQYQHENGFLPYKVFDILYYKGVNVQSMPLWKRKVYAAIVCYYINNVLDFPFIQFVDMYVSSNTWKNLYELWYDYISVETEYPTDILAYLCDHVYKVDSYSDLFNEFVSQGIEGLIIKPINGIYEQKRSKNYLKMKGVSTWDVVVMGYTEPTKEYEGKLLEEGRMEEWPYWETTDGRIHFSYESAKKSKQKMIPVTKPYAMGWIGAIRCGVYKRIEAEEIADLFGPKSTEAMKLKHWYYDNVEKEYRALVHVADVKGLPDEILEDIKINGEKYVRERRVLEILANGLIDKETGSLRHPRFSRWRDDKEAKLCTWEAHIREMN